MLAMIKLNLQFSTKSSTKCSGGITIMMAMLLLVLTLGSAIYTAKTKLLDLRITNADYRKNQAIQTAEAGLQRAIAQLDIEPNFTGTITVSTNDNDYQVSVTPLLNGITFANSPLWDNDIIVQLRATGHSDDHTSSNTISQQIWLHSIVRAIPHATVTVLGEVTINGMLSITANPHGGGRNLPLSIWSSAAVSITGNGATCAIDEYDHGVCASHSYSNKTTHGSDILADNAQASGGTFANDLFAATFGIAMNQSSSLKQRAVQQLSSCSNLSSATTGLIWLNGDCTISTNSVIGSAAAPVILVMENGNLKLNSNATLFALVYFLNTTATTSQLSIKNGAEIRGAVMSQQSLKLTGGNAGIRFDPAVLAVIAQRSQAQFSHVEAIPGSWKDF